MSQLNITNNYPPQDEILTSGALAFLEAMVQRFGAERDRLMDLRAERQEELDAGALPRFDPETASIRESDWRVAPLASQARDRRTEITGPVSRKMVINALNSGAQVFMADFEDSTSPGWENMIDGQVNLRDAVNGSIDFENQAGKQYRLDDETALLMVRPRGWHLPEVHIQSGGAAIPGALFDFAMFMFHNHQQLTDNGSLPFFYLPKLEHYLEARLWEEVISWSEEQLGLENGSCKVTVLIETLPAAFQMDEILYELRNRIQGLNCGRWDYIFSYIKCLKNHPTYLLPDRASITMDKGFLRAYSQLLIQTCHRRGAMAMGGMAAQIPIRGDEQANTAALEKVRLDKRREAESGHDGTWVAHPGLEPVARAEFDRIMTGPNQLHRKLKDLSISADDLLRPVTGEITRNGMSGNIEVALLYLSAWLDGNGCVPIHHLMEDAATAEISRAQLWQWIRHPDAQLEDDSQITEPLYLEMKQEILEKLLSLDNGPREKTLEAAAGLLDQLTLNDSFDAFLTLRAYSMIS